MARHRREKWACISGIVLIALSALLVISLKGSPEPIGRFNQHLQGGARSVFGILAWVLPVAGVYWGWKLIVGGRYRRVIIFSAWAILGFLTLATFSRLAAGVDASSKTNLGGKLGHHFALALGTILGSWGSLIIMLTALAVFFIVTTGISPRRVAAKVDSSCKSAVKAVPGFFFPPAPKGDSARRARVARRNGAREPEEELGELEQAEEEIEEPEEAEAEPAPTRPSIVVAPSRLKPGRAQEPPEQGSLGLLAADGAGAGETGAEYVPPPLSLFEDPVAQATIGDEELMELAQSLEAKLARFDIIAKVVEIHPGPVITSFELEPGSSTKVHQVVNLADDLALALKARSIRIVAPIPGKGTIGIEIPNRNPSAVSVKEILGSKRFTASKSRLEIALGKDVAGNPYTGDLESMPHLLIAGATGSGKSVCINSIITSLVFRNSPQQVQLLLIDPKRLELNLYEGIPHLVSEVVTEPKKAVRALGWVVEEMDLRYQLLASRGVRNIQSYDEGLPYIVIIIDELADLMLMVPQEMEMAVSRLAQMARAVGIHLVVATQRPSVDVITGVIKANFPCRIAFKVASKTDSRTILDANGAERLLGKGDMLMMPPATAEPIRLHGAYVSSQETQRMVEFLKKQSHLAAPAFSLESEERRGVGTDFKDELFEDAARIVITHKQGSVSLLQRRLKIGYSRAARLVDILEAHGIVGPFEGSKARQVLVDESYLENLSGKR
ncbi:MAG TPA: DNA translocase FtsK 4TM domain-containing protein [bacterium]|nr:DNA translocase FtsK 4TM domain-containing protein [bacterium]